MAKSIKDLLKVKEKAITMRHNWDDVWDELAYYIIPSKVGFNSKHMPGERFKWSRRYDTTAGQANKTLANHLHMALCSPSSPWFEGRFSDPELNKMDVAQEWSEEVTHRMFEAFNYSNFNGQINTFFQTLCAFGTSCLTSDFISTPQHPFRLVFRNIKLSNVCFDVDMHEKMDTVFHDYKLTKKQAEEMFGKKFEDERDEDVKVCRIVRPNENWKPDSLNPKERMFICDWVYKEESFSQEGHFDMPYHLVRFEGIDDDPIYGEGPGLLCLSDIRSLNKAKALEFRGYEKAIDPPLLGASGAIIGDLHINAGGFTQVRDPRMIGEMPGRMDAQLVMFKGEELRDSIRKAYKIDELLVPERKGQNPATATEIQIRYEQMQKMMGATVGRIEAELLQPMVQRVFGIMLRNKQLPEIPEEIQGEDFDFRYTGPLAKSQVSQDAVAIERYLQAEMAVAQVDPNALMVGDHMKMMRVLADRYSTPAEVIRSEREVEVLQQEAEAKQQAMEEQEMAQQGAATQQSQAEADAAQVQLLENVQNLR